MRFDVLTLFPEIFTGYLSQSLLKLAIDRGLVRIDLHNIRDWTHDKHHCVDDRPFGGGPGMVIKPEPVVEAVEAVQTMGETPGQVVLLSPQGRPLDQRLVEELAAPPAAAAPVRAVRRVRPASERHPEAAGGFDRRFRHQRRRSRRDGGDRRGRSGWCPACWETKTAAVTIRFPRATACWNLPNTPARASTAGSKCPMCCSAATTARSPGGATRAAGNEPNNDAPTYYHKAATGGRAPEPQVMSQQILANVEKSSLKPAGEIVDFAIGDTVDVHTKIMEGDKERIQIFSGVVIARSGSGSREMFTVRRIVAGQGVERKFPLHSPRIAKIEVKRSGKRPPGQAVLHARASGKATRLRERRTDQKGGDAAE